MRDVAGRRDVLGKGKGPGSDEPADADRVAEAVCRDQSPATRGLWRLDHPPVDGLARLEMAKRDACARRRRSRPDRHRPAGEAERVEQQTVVSGLVREQPQVGGHVPADTSRAARAPLEMSRRQRIVEVRRRHRQLQTRPHDRPAALELLQRHAHPGIEQPLQPHQNWHIDVPISTSPSTVPD